MPDNWEGKHGLNPDEAGDGALDADGNGCTDLAEYWNSLVPTIY
jgi:hypothetical protein